MKTISAGLVLLATAAVALASENFPKPVKVSFATEPQETAVASLPEGLRARLAGDPDKLFDRDDKLAETLDVMPCDLNGDGAHEYFVADPSSYTGGRMFHIFGSARTGFAPIGCAQGEFYFAKPVNGYYQIVSTARAGGDSYERRLEVFKKDRYVETRAAEYRLTDGDKLEFVGDLKAP